MMYQAGTVLRSRPARRTARRRARKKRIRRMLTVFALLAIVVWASVSGVRHVIKLGSAPAGIGNGTSSIGADWHDITVEEDTISAIQELSWHDSRAEEILQHPERYPASFLDMLAKNPETLDFVLGYPEHGDDKPAERLDESLDEMPLLIQWDSRWGYQPYGDSTVAVSGCAPTCLAMVAAYLTRNAELTPCAVADFAASEGYYVSGTGTSWELFHHGTRELGVIADELPLDESVINAALDRGHPVICSMMPGDFTTQGHFIVLCRREDGGYIVRDPNSRERSERVWTYSEISKQINNLWECSAE